jgi:hypothetical protein
VWTALGHPKLDALICLSPNGGWPLYRHGEVVQHAKNGCDRSRCMASRARGRPAGQFSAPTDSKLRPHASTCPRGTVAAMYHRIREYSRSAGPMGGQAAQVLSHRLKVAPIDSTCPGQVGARKFHLIWGNKWPVGPRIGWPAHFCV